MDDWQVFLNSPLTSHTTSRNGTLLTCAVNREGEPEWSALHRIPSLEIVYEGRANTPSLRQNGMAPRWRDADGSMAVWDVRAQPLRVPCDERVVEAWDSGWMEWLSPHLLEVREKIGEGPVRIYRLDTGDSQGMPAPPAAHPSRTMPQASASPAARRWGL